MKKLLTIALVLLSINAKANNEDLIKWATENAIATFNYNALNFKEKLSSLKPNFTTEGWQRYKQALNESGNIDQVVDNNLIVSAEVNGTPVVTEISKHKWGVAIPAEVSYTNEHATMTQDVTTYIVVEEVNKKYAISDINSMLNKPASIAKITPHLPRSCQISVKAK